MAGRRRRCGWVRGKGGWQDAGALKILFQESKSFSGTPAAAAHGDHLPVKKDRDNACTVTLVHDEDQEQEEEEEE